MARTTIGTFCPLSGAPVLIAVRYCTEQIDRRPLFFAATCVSDATGEYFHCQPSLTVGEVWLAITLGAALGSILSFHFGALIMRNKLSTGLLTRHEEKLQNIRRKLENNGVLVLFGSRFIAVLRYMVPLAAGMLPLKRFRVYCVSLFSAAIWAALFVGITSGALLIIPPMI